MIQQSKFTNITHLFYSGSYEQGQKQLTEIIKRESSNSNLYVNHALFLSQLGQDQQALRELEKALSINPRNYIGYFNMFSIQTRMMEDDAAFANLCCSLSCMYLIRARNAKSIEDASIAISYSDNNYEAHVLKGLLLMQKQNYQEARASFQKALEFDPNNQVIKRLKRIAVQTGQLQEDEDIAIADNQEKDYRLKSTYKSIDGQDLYEEIQSKLAEFNKLYIDINSTSGAVTQKVPKESNLMENRNSHIRSNHDEVKIIFDSGMSTPHKKSEMHPEPGNYLSKSSMLMENENGNEKSFVSCKVEGEDIPQESFLSIVNDQKQLAPEIEGPILLQQSQGAQQNQQHFQSLISQVKQEQFDRQEPAPSQILEQSQPQLLNIIYPLDEGMQLQISVLNLQFLQPDEAFFSRLTDVYCIISYNNGKSKLKTATKTCQNGICAWNQQFQPVPISPAPSDMKIKIYNKIYTQVRDEYLGDLEVLITTADLLRLPLFSKKGILGHLLLNLQLVQVPAVTSPLVFQQDF